MADPGGGAQGAVPLLLLNIFKDTKKIWGHTPKPGLRSLLSSDSRDAPVYNTPYMFRILVQVTIYRGLLIGRDGHLDQLEAYDISTILTVFRPIVWSLRADSCTCPQVDVVITAEKRSRMPHLRPTAANVDLSNMQRLGNATNAPSCTANTRR